MKTPLSLTICALLGLSFLQLHQRPEPGAANAFCAQAELHAQKLQEDDAYRLATRRLEEELDTLAPWNSQNDYSTGRGPLVQHTLPVVVHIIHNGGSENISDGQAADAIQHLNDAFANVGYYNPATGVDTEIAFCLARRTPQGEATTGINRVQSALTNLNNSTDDLAMKALSRWDPTRYINVWVVNEICSNNGCGVAGYAYLPGAHGQPYDGIVLEAAYMGSNPTASTVLVHEMGHYLGLYHTFEGGCPNDDCRQQGDRICDTPPDNTTARPPCSSETNSCSSDEDDPSVNNPFRSVAQGGLGDQPDMKENYMDYSRFECYDRFTQGQKDRMLNVVENIRSSLLNAPGCIDPCPAPIAVGFSASALSVPIGTMVNFTNTSANADSYEWAIDGTPFSTTANASYTFNAEGNFQVTLTAFSNQSNCLPADSTLTIEVFCPVVAGFTGGDTTVLAGASVTFNNTSSNATSYTWLVNGTAVSSSPDFTLNTTEAGLYNVCLTAGNDLCEAIQCNYLEATTPSGGGCGTFYFFTIGQVGADMRGSVLAPAVAGGYYLGGSFDGQSIIMKLNEEGSIEWQYLLPFSEEENILDLEEDEQGFLIGSGIRSGAATDGFCFKFDPQGQAMVWANYFAPLPRSRLYKILNREALPYYIILGESYNNPSTNGNGCDATFTMIDKSSGQVLDQRHFNLGTCEYFHNAIMTDDAVYATGRYNNAFNGEYAIRPVLAKLSLTGDMEWSRLYLKETPGFTARLYGRDIVRDGNELVIAGYGDLNGTSASNVVLTLFKTDLDGNILWGRQMDVPGAINERLHMIFNLSDGYLLIGRYEQAASPGDSNVIFIKTNKAGVPQWIKTFDNLGDEEVIDQGAFMRDGSLYITGTTSNDSGVRAFVMKFDPQLEPSRECLALTPFNVESSALQDPYDGFHDVIAYDYIRPHSAPSISPASTQLETGNFCGAPCEECNNGLDDDNDGLVDCEDDDCPCFEDCGGTFVELIGTPARDEGAIAIIPSADGNFYVGGYAGEEAAILKMAPDGAILWQRTFDFSEGPDQIKSLLLADDGYLYGTNSNTHATVFCYDPENDIVLWSNTFYNIARLNNVSINPTNGNILACGGLIFPTSDPVLMNEFPGTTYPQFDIAMTVELGRNTGALNWRKEYQAGSSSTTYEMIWIGDIYYSPARFTHNAGQPKMRPSIAAFNANGEVAWSKYYILPASASARMYAFCMERASDGLVSGFMGDPTGTDLYGASRTGLFKTDFAGNLQWAKWYQLAGYNAVLGTFGMAKAPDGYLLYGYAVGNSRDLTVIKTDEEGNALWAMAYGGTGDEDTPFNGGSQILQAGNSIYLVGRSQENGTENMVIIRANAEDGAILGGDCIYATPIPISTELLPNAVEEPAGLIETPFSAITPQLRTVQPVAALMDTTRLCGSSPVDMLLALDSAYCNGDSLSVTLRICNEGTDTLAAGLPFTFYDGNPTADAAATVLSAGLAIPAAILPGECHSTTVPLPYPQGQLYCIANDDGSLPPIFSLETDFPPTEFIECDYTNNIDSVSYETTAPEINLGPDTTVCENGVFLLDAGPGFAAYRWQDGAAGQTYTAYEPGTYWVEGATACGGVSRDTIHILLDNVFPATLGSDSSICAGSSAILSTVEYPGYSYQWLPESSLDCTNCPTVTAQPDSTTTYTLVASNGAGCVSVDSITLTVLNCDATLDTAICANDSILIEGLVLYANQSVIIPITEDSILNIHVSAIDTALTLKEVKTCLGEPYDFNGLELPGGSVTPFIYTSANGCDSTLLLTVTELEEIQTYDTVQICQGETGEVFGQPVTEPGLYSEMYTSYLGCDSTHNINLAVLDTAVLRIDPGQLNCATLSGSLTVAASGGTPPYTFLWDDGQTTATATGLAAGTYAVTVTDAEGCQSMHVQEVSDSISRPEVELVGTPVSCFGNKDGAILVINPTGGTPPYEYSLTGAQWQQEGLFTGLDPGPYVIYVRDKDLCEGFYLVTVSEPELLGIILPADTTLRLGDSIRLTPNTISGAPSFFEWAPPTGLDCTDCPNPIAGPQESTLYRLTARDSSGCTGTDEIFIEIDNTLRIYLPNAFSPNEDGRNDYFSVFAGPEVERVQTLQIFGRWGEQVFKRDNFAPNQESLGWDGTFRGLPMPGGVYAYYGVVLLIDGRVEVVKGEVVLVR
ncbi:MAG: gliding motility-associated C-terminal domain-containing protein [Lewinellaceae bacterium]|nr:gliding motility-associated C-terminal domain-containing protein [Lewinellaceae bacterium]